MRRRPRSWSPRRAATNWCPELVSMTIEDDIAFFERVPTLGLLGRGALRILAIGVESRYVHSGEGRFTAGDDADSGFIGQEGSFILAPNPPEPPNATTV